MIATGMPASTPQATPPSGVENWTGVLGKLQPAKFMRQSPAPGPRPAPSRSQVGLAIGVTRPLTFAFADHHVKQVRDDEARDPEEDVRVLDLSAHRGLPSSVGGMRKPPPSLHQPALAEVVQDQLVERVLV